MPWGGTAILKEISIFHSHIGTLPLVGSGLPFPLVFKLLQSIKSITSLGGGVGEGGGGST